MILQFNPRQNRILIVSLLWLLLAVFGCETQGAPVGPGSVSTFDTTTATQAYLDRLTTAQKAHGNAYFEGGYWLQLWQFLYGASVALVFLQMRLSARMRDFACLITRRKPLQSVVYGILYILLTAVLTFPLIFYSDFAREHQYGLATQGFAEWLGDWSKKLVVTVVLGCALIAPLAGVVRRLPRTWYIWAAAVTLGLLVFTMLIGPVFIAPLFNKYTLVSDPKIVAPILRIAHANGIATDKVFEMDASKQSTRISANVSGILGTMRITLNDNLLKHCSLPEIEAVMAHEIGHYVLNHVYKMILFFGVVIVVGFALLYWAVERLLAVAGSRWGILNVGDVAATPLFVLLFSTYLFALTPLINTFIRTQEIEADMFGLNAARQPDGFAEATLKLAEYRKLEPTAIEEWIFYDHPSGATRIGAAMRWKAENIRPTE